MNGKLVRCTLQAHVIAARLGVSRVRVTMVGLVWSGLGGCEYETRIFFLGILSCLKRSKPPFSGVFSSHGKSICLHIR